MTVPKGYLVSVGGAEDKGTDLERGIIERNRLNFFELGILKNIIDLIPDGEVPRVEVVTTASMIPEEVAENYLDAFSKLGCKNAGHINIRDRKDAYKQEYLERLKDCNCIMFSGGNQLRLTSIFGGTEFLNTLHRKYKDEQFVIGGTSAGAMAMSSTMIYEGNADTAHLKGEVKLTSGLGFIPSAIIDSHFNKRGRFNRLAQGIAAQPGALGIGLGEDTGIIVSEGIHVRVIGSGAVVILDGSHVGYNSIASITAGMPISVENIMVHLLSSGDMYNLETRKMEGSGIVVEDDGM